MYASPGGMSDVRYVPIPRRVPNRNACVEAFVANLKRECLDHFACFGQRC